MTRSDRSDWVEDRLSRTPRELAAAVRELLDGAGADPTPAFMASRALGALDRVAATSGTREGALDLLAADALLTYAFESAADPRIGGSADRVLDLARATGPAGELGRRSETRS